MTEPVVNQKAVDLLNLDAVLLAQRDACRRLLNDDLEREDGEDTAEYMNDLRVLFAAVLWPQVTFVGEAVSCAVNGETFTLS